MTEARFVRLPAEILHTICSLLYDSHKLSLKSLSLVNKQLCQVSSTWCFRHLKLLVRGSRSLTKDLTELLLVLQRRDTLIGVHRITLSGVLQDDAHQKRQVSVDQAKRWFFIESDWDTIYGVGDGLPMLDYDQRTRPDPEDLETFWEPLVSIIRCAPGLQYLDYNCRNAVPMNIVKALEQFRPACRLHVGDFRLHDLTNERRFPKEIRLLQSPVLDSIHCQYIRRYPREPGEYHASALLRTFGGIIPNLRHVTLRLTATASIVWYRPSPDQAQPQWKGFESSVGPDHPANLESFTCNYHLSQKNIDGFTRAVNFANLKHLALESSISNSVLRYFTNDVQFFQLRSLSLSLSKQGSSHDVPRREQDAFEPASLLMSLPPLESLSISGYISESVVDAIFSRHGVRLRALTLKPNDAAYWRTGTFHKSCLSLDEYRRLRDSCPHLVDLRIPVQRSKSKGKEVKCYLALAGCRNLRNLFLELRCDRPNVRHPGTDDSPTSTDSESDNINLSLGQSDATATRAFRDRRPRPSDIRDAFMNCAMDENLARSIWRVIAGRKRGFPLRSLKLSTVGAHNFGGNTYPLNLRYQTRELSGTFLLERPPRDDALPDDVMVQELTAHRDKIQWDYWREQAEKTAERWDFTDDDDDDDDHGHGHDEHYDEHEDDYDDDDYYKNGGRFGDPSAPFDQIFRSIWPERKSSRGEWNEDWSSIPLQLEQCDQVET